jgi:hypothetical protein
LKHNVELTRYDFEQLLLKQSTLEKYQDKWLKNLSDGEIQKREYLYTLKVTDNKRELIYDNKNLLISTVPFIINKD